MGNCFAQMCTLGKVQTKKLVNLHDNFLKIENGCGNVESGTEKTKTARDRC